MDKQKARSAVSSAVRQGLLPVVYKLACIDCGCRADEYHHWSYERQHWLDVVPYCRRCHRALHVRRGDLKLFKSC